MEKKYTAEGTLFILEHPFDGRGKWLFILYAALFLLPGFGFIYLISAFWIGPVVELLIPIGLGTACFIIGFRYLTSAWRKDTLLITSDKIILTEQKGFQKMQRSFSRTGIDDIRFLEKPELTPHPLAGKTFDYLGFQVQDQVINEMFGDHRISFQYEDQTISFGRKLFSWDYTAIREALFGASADVEEELPWNVITSWKDYWEAYDALVASISNEKAFIRQAVEDARLYVNGLTDGWGDHRDALKQLLIRYEDQLTVDQRGQLKEFIQIVEDTVMRR